MFDALQFGPAVIREQAPTQSLIFSMECGRVPPRRRKLRDLRKGRMMVSARLVNTTQLLPSEKVLARKAQ